jgi:hypothetical protein
MVLVEIGVTTRAIRGLGATITVGPEDTETIASAVTGATVGPAREEATSEVVEDLR